MKHRSSDSSVRFSRENQWRFLESGSPAAAKGEFTLADANAIGRLYFPLANEFGALSWVSPRLHGGLAISHHAQLAPPLTVEDFTHTLLRRDFWIVRDKRAPFAASGISPQELDPDRALATRINAGPGWFQIMRRQPGGLELTVTLWCPSDVPAAVEVMRVEVANASDKPATFVSYAMLPIFARSADNLREHRHVTALLHRVFTKRFGLCVRPTMSFDERGHKLNTLNYLVLACGPSAKAPQGIWGLEESFTGEGGTLAAPAAVWRRRLRPKPDRAKSGGKEAIAGFRFTAQTLRPGERAVFTLLSGITAKAGESASWLRFIRRDAALQRSLEKTKRRWQAIAHPVSFSSGEPPLDNWLAWVGLQPTLRRLYGNSFLPQFDYGRGGRGWRDLWQDRLALLLSDPASVRPMLLHNFGGVRIDGSNATIIGKQREFIADRNNIPRTWMDHGAWPLHATLLYIDQTGDLNFLLQKCPYFRDMQLFRCRSQDLAWTPKRGFRLRTRQGKIYRGTVLEHLLVQNLTAFFNVGEHNLCRLEGADWNDGLDMAARRGESVAFSAFYAWNLRRLAETSRLLLQRGTAFIDVAAELLLLLDRTPGSPRVPYASARQKTKRLYRYLAAVSRDISGRTARIALRDLADDLKAKAKDISRRIQRTEWLQVKNGGFFNGYYDDSGRRVEGLFGRGMRMTLTGQVFPLMSGIADETQVNAAIDSVDRWLRNADGRSVRLNTDFGEPQPHLGRAFSFAYGEKENGAVFSHMAIMYAYALYLRRRAAEGRRVWRSLYELAVDQPAAKIFPCLPEYFNREHRGMYCYLTGSASWLIYLLLTQVYGVRGELGDLVIDPQLDWDDFKGRTAVSVQAPFAGKRLEVVVKNSARLRAGGYQIARVETDAGPIVFERRPQGGIRIARRVIQNLRQKDRTLNVTLTASTQPKNNSGRLLKTARRFR